MGNFIALLGFGRRVGIVPAMEGSRASFHLPSRKTAAWLIAGSLLTLIVRAGIAGPGDVPDPVTTPSPTGSPTPSPTPDPTPSPTPGPTLSATPTLPAGVPAGVQPGFVARNIDGDTIWVEVREPGPLLPSAVHKIRILEIDTPESTTQQDCLGKEATEFARRELPVGSKVYLLADRQDRDRYGRFLRYVWKENGEFYNEKAIREGFARAVLYPPNDLYIDQLRAAEGEARRSARGLWKACAVPSPPT